MKSLNIRRHEKNHMRIYMLVYSFYESERHHTR